MTPRPIYSTLFFSGEVLSGLSGFPIAVPPAGGVLVIRDVDLIADFTIGAMNCSIAICDFPTGPGPNNAFATLQGTAGTGDAKQLYWRGRTVCPDGQYVGIVCNGGPYIITVSGYTLTN